MAWKKSKENGVDGLEGRSKDENEARLRFKVFRVGREAKWNLWEKTRLLETEDGLAKITWWE